MALIRDYFFSSNIYTRIFRLSLFVISLFALIVASVPELKEMAQSSVRKSEFRHILSVASGDLLSNGSNVKVVKVKTQHGLFLEVYGASENFNRPLLERILLPDKTDGYFHFRGQATNLALDDIDGDNKLEIIAPSFDRDLIAHLNVYKYNQETKRFELRNP